MKFSVKNDGNQVTEFYLLAEDGLRIVGEVENVGPGLSRDLVVIAPAGKVLHRVQAGHGWRRHPCRIHRDRRRRKARPSAPTAQRFRTPR